MGITKQLLFLWAAWCFLDKVHSSCIKTVSAMVGFKHSQIVPSLQAKIFSENGKSKKVEQILPKIYGGEDAPLGKWPWMVALFYRKKSTKSPLSEFRCGGVLISDRWVITAAHCIDENEELELFLRLGDLDLNDRVEDGASPKNVAFGWYKTHEHFAPCWLKHDIAMIKLKKKIKFTRNIQSIPLLSGGEYEKEDYYNGKEAFVIGWGNIRDHSGVSSHLQQTRVYVKTPDECAKEYKKIYPKKTDFIDKYKICAIGHNSISCKGDSGGPLMFFNDTDKRYYLGGIASSGFECSSSGPPAVYTKVAKYIRWINETMNWH